MPTGRKKERNGPRHVRIDLRLQRLNFIFKQPRFLEPKTKAGETPSDAVRNTP
jgi:hypothetical protein